jgi:ppGpp synthetase/RelA/SpoT-type nucleotidyltranferase
MMTKSEIDQLGHRLRRGSLDELALRQLDEFRLSFQSAIAHVVQTLQKNAEVESSMRPSKSTPSIIAKLLRQPSLRLSQIQDIAGLRVIVPGFREQDSLRDEVLRLFKQSKPKVYDRRENPRFGYRAVHVVVEVDKHLVEIQIRTHLQHLWAQVSEEFADLIGHHLKYQASDDSFVIAIREFSDTIQQRHLLENQVLDIKERVAQALAQTDNESLALNQLRQRLNRLNQDLYERGVLMASKLDMIVRIANLLSAAKKSSSSK